MLRPLALPIEYNKDFGNYCYPWSKTSAFLKGMAWTDEPMCYIPCDPKKCPGVPRHKTNFLWAAEADGVNLCYSYEKCGGVDKETPYVMGCEAKGGYLLNGQVGDAFDMQYLHAHNSHDLCVAHFSARAISTGSSARPQRLHHTAIIRTVANARGTKAFTRRMSVNYQTEDFLQAMVGATQSFEDKIRVCTCAPQHDRRCL